jgi:hypothetical protein
MKKSLSAPPGGVKTKTRSLKRRASARPALSRSRRRRKPAALATYDPWRLYEDFKLQTKRSYRGPKWTLRKWVGTTAEARAILSVLKGRADAALLKD